VVPGLLPAGLRPRERDAISHECIQLRAILSSAKAPI
jgi:hypothetical protein